jgi:cytochrome c-type biogenesis protein CcmH
MLKKTLLPILFSLFFGLLIVGVAAAQQPTPSDDQVNAIAKQLYCPVCENIPLDVCPTTACAQWRELIRQKLADGWSEQQIKEYFVQQYGSRVIGTPNRWLYLIPIIAIVIGGYILYRVYRSWKQPTQLTGISPASDLPPIEKISSPDEYIQRLEDEVRKR